MPRMLGAMVVLLKVHIRLLYYDHFMLLHLDTSGPLYRRIYEAVTDELARSARVYVRFAAER
jgi:hypothetical protein